jgi:hypothetical protein
MGFRFLSAAVRTSLSDLDLCCYQRGTGAAYSFCPFAQGVVYERFKYTHQRLAVGSEDSHGDLCCSSENAYQQDIRAGLTFGPGHTHRIYHIMREAEGDALWNSKGFGLHQYNHHTDLLSRTSS